MRSSTSSDICYYYRYHSQLLHVGAGQYRGACNTTPPGGPHPPSYLPPTTKMSREEPPARVGCRLACRPPHSGPRSGGLFRFPSHPRSERLEHLEFPTSLDELASAPRIHPTRHTTAIPRSPTLCPQPNPIQSPSPSHPENGPRRPVAVPDATTSQSSRGPRPHHALTHSRSPAPTCTPWRSPRRIPARRLAPSACSDGSRR